MLTGLDFNMEQTLWVTAFILALLKTGLDFSQDVTKGNGTLEVQGSISTRTNNSYPPKPVSGNSFPRDTSRAPLPPITVSLSLMKQKAAELQEKIPHDSVGCFLTGSWTR